MDFPHPSPVTAPAQGLQGGFSHTQGSPSEQRCGGAGGHFARRAGAVRTPARGAAQCLTRLAPTRPRLPAYESEYPGRNRFAKPLTAAVMSEPCFGFPVSG